MYYIKDLYKLKVTYTIVFLSLIFWAFFAFYTMNQLISNQEVYAKIINISGKQRMLSQKTALISKRFFESNDKKLFIHLRELISTMKNDHKFIIDNLSSKRMYKVYFSKKLNLDEKVKLYFSYLDEFLLTNNRDLLKKIEDYSFSLLPKLNHAVYEFENESNKKIKELKNRELYILLGTLLTIFLEAAFIVIPSIKFNKKSKDELEKINKNLEENIKIEVEKARQKDLIIANHAKELTMKEILNNIAHQWRQPLSLITTSASGLKLKREFEGKLDNKELDTSLDLIIKNANYLSFIIENFRDFFQDDNPNGSYTLKRVYKRAIQLLKHKIDANSISINSNIDEIMLVGNENKLINVFIHLLNNAIDATSKLNKDKYIFVNVKNYMQSIAIDIIDNGGGIDEIHLEKIFEPYFTTKHQSIGKGLDLYICKQSIKNIFNGSIEATNLEYTHLDKKEYGARFIINLPK